MSSDITLIRFADNKSSYSSEFEVGGEYRHITQFDAKIGESFRIRLTPPSSSLQLYVDGEGITKDSSEPLEIVIGSTRATRIEVTVTSHPTTEWTTLTITPLR